MMNNLKQREIPQIQAGKESPRQGEASGPSLERIRPGTHQGVRDLLIRIFIYNLWERYSRLIFIVDIKKSRPFYSSKSPRLKLGDVFGVETLFHQGFGERITRRFHFFVVVPECLWIFRQGYPVYFA